MRLLFYKLPGGEKGLATGHKVVARGRIDQDISREATAPARSALLKAGKMDYAVHRVVAKSRWR